MFGRAYSLDWQVQGLNFCVGRFQADSPVAVVGQLADPPSVSKSEISRAHAQMQAECHLQECQQLFLLQNNSRLLSSTRSTISFPIV